MVYTFGLVKHANIRYRDSLIRLSRFELQAMLNALSIDCDIVHEILGGMDFLSFDSRILTAKELGFLSCHSNVVFFAQKEKEVLSPLDM